MEIHLMLKHMCTYVFTERDMLIMEVTEYDFV